jgi:DNA topoisomerase-1
MARTTKKKSSKKKTTKRSASGSGGGRGRSAAAPDCSGKHLVIVESPTKARTINRYLGSDYCVLASVGHVRDLPKSAPKGAKRADHPVPGVDLDKRFEPTYEVLPDKKKTITELRKAAKQAADVWFATDLDREGEAIAWHLAEALGVPTDQAKRVVFNAITKDQIDRAFDHPRNIDQSKVDAQQARRILDRIVGYQVSPLLWKKVAGGLSAGRVQSVATRLVVERERAIDAFVPDEYWKIGGIFASDAEATEQLQQQWNTFTHSADVISVKDQNAWLSDHACLKAELVEIDGNKFTAEDRGTALSAAKRLGFRLDDTQETDDPEAKGPAQHLVSFLGGVDDATDHGWRITSIQTRRSTSRPSPPFITSTMQQQASNRLGFNLQRTMRVAQQLYEGIDIKGGRGQTGLITYMRTDSTHLSGEAVAAVRGYVGDKLGPDYLPEKPNFYKSSNASAQEAHEAIRPTDVSIKPSDIQGQLSDEQFKLYDLIWRRFVSCQLTPAQWDGTTVQIKPHPDGELDAIFKATGRRLVFDGFYRIMGVPRSDDVVLPELSEQQPVGAVDLSPTQHFTSPPPRYTEASLQKKLEEEGIGRPSTYASIIGVIQNRRYVEPVAPRDKRLRATDLGQVVTDKLIEAFPRIMDVPYTRQMEDQLDHIETDQEDWRAMLEKFYGPFKENLDTAHETMTHAKAETQPADYACETCGAPTEYRFGRNGKFLSCSRYPDCKYAAPIDAKGRPQQPEQTDIVCPEDGARMILRKGRFGPFLSSPNYPDVKYIVKLDAKKGHVVLPKTEPLLTDIDCPKCGDENDAKLNLRDSKRGLWLSCSRFPKCRGRVGFGKLEEDVQQKLEKAWKAHEKAHPVDEIKTITGHVITDDEQYIPQVAGAASDTGDDAAAE